MQSCYNGLSLVDYCSRIVKKQKKNCLIKYVSLPSHTLPFSRLSPLFSLIFFSFLLLSFSHAYASASSPFLFFFVLPQPKPLFPSLNSRRQTHLCSLFFVLSSWVCVDWRSPGSECGFLVWSVDRRVDRSVGLIVRGSKRGSKES